MANRRRPAEVAPGIRNRVVALIWVRAGDLLPDPRNWRTHPAEQRRALRHMLESVGFADVVLVRQEGERYRIIDGHLRADDNPDAIVPCLVLDVDEYEAGLLLASLDPLAAMADADAEKLQELVGTLPELADHLDHYLADLIAEQTEWGFDPDNVDNTEPANTPIKGRITVTCPSERRDEIRALVVTALAGAGEGVAVS